MRRALLLFALIGLVPAASYAADFEMDPVYCDDCAVQTVDYERYVIRAIQECMDVDAHNSLPNIPEGYANMDLDCGVFTAVTVILHANNRLFVPTCPGDDDLIFYPGCVMVEVKIDFEGFDFGLDIEIFGFSLSIFDKPVRIRGRAVLSTGTTDWQVWPTTILEGDLVIPGGTPSTNPNINPYPNDAVPHCGQSWYDVNNWVGSGFFPPTGWP